jgi:hypothetical protein
MSSRKRLMSQELIKEGHMNMSKIAGAQLYTIRDYAKTPEDINESLRKIKEIGYTTVHRLRGSDLFRRVNWLL